MSEIIAALILIWPVLVLIYGALVLFLPFIFLGILDQQKRTNVLLEDLIKLLSKRP